jgi:hypothetical protein
VSVTVPVMLPLDPTVPTIFEAVPPFVNVRPATVMVPALAGVLKVTVCTFFVGGLAWSVKTVPFVIVIVSTPVRLLLETVAVSLAKVEAPL